MAVTFKVNPEITGGEATKLMSRAEAETTEFQNLYTEVYNILDPEFEGASQVVFDERMREWTTAAEGLFATMQSLGSWLQTLTNNATELDQASAGA